MTTSLTAQDIADLRAAVSSGTGHDCEEWRDGNTCVLCDSPLPCQHDWDVIASVMRAETVPNNHALHTSCMLLGCWKCRLVDAFPAGNAALISAPYVDKLRRDLAAGGWILPQIEWRPGFAWRQSR